MRLIFTFLIFSFLAVSGWGQLNVSGPTTVDFSGYTGAGIGGGSGQLGSEWAITSLSPLNLGSTNGGVSTGGLYNLNPNEAIWIQPGGSDWTPGTLTLTIENATGATITEIQVNYDLLYRNDQQRGNSFNFSWSSDNITYNPISALDFTTPAASDMLGIQSLSQTTTITGLSLAAGGNFYIRWEGDDVSGSGSRDEYGIDNVVITPTTAPPCSATTNTALPSSDELLDATHTCEEGDWTYYAASAAGPYLFGINWAPDGSISAANQTAKDNVQIEIDANSPQSVVDANSGTWTMGRYWNVVTDPIDENVSIRFFYDPAEKTATTNAASGSGFSPVETPVWFKTTTSEFDPILSVSSTGIGGNAIDLTSNVVSDGMMLGGTTYVEFENISSFSGGTWAAGAGTVGAANALPVEFASVEARRTDDGNVKVQWSTASEVNNDHFVVQHSVDGREFKSFASVEGAGTTYEAMAYSAEHSNPIKGINYYRIAQTDYDGTTSYSDIVSIQMSDALTLQLRPTIVEHTLSYDVGNSAAKMIIMSIDGSMYQEQYIDNQGQVDCSHLAPGLYTITVVTGTESVTQRITKI